MNTNELRRASWLEGQENAGRFDRALVEWPAGLRIAKVGISDANRWRYCDVYDLLPDPVAAARLRGWRPAAVAGAALLVEMETPHPC